MLGACFSGGNAFAGGAFGGGAFGGGMGAAQQKQRQPNPGESQIEFIFEEGVWLAAQTGRDVTTGLGCVVRTGVVVASLARTRVLAQHTSLLHAPTR